MDEIRDLTRVVDVIVDRPDLPRRRLETGVERAMSLIAEARRKLTPIREVRVILQDGTERDYDPRESER